jgi:hypothetical protein
MNPAIPTEIWMLWLHDTESGEDGWLCTSNDTASGDVFYCTASKDAAAWLAARQFETNGNHCTPVRVK